MATYLIDPRRNGGDQFAVEADSHGDAAKLAACEIFPKLAQHIRAPGSPYFIHRESGSDEGSGMFKLWKFLRGVGNQQSDHGEPFHVMER